MRLILNEENFIKNIIDTKDIPDDLSKTYLITLLAKCLVEKTDNEKTLSVKVKKYMSDFDFSIIEYQEYRWSKKIFSVCKNVIDDNLKLRKLDYIPLFKSELDKIQELNTDKEKKILFVMYLVARFMNCDGWVNISIRDIFKMANISTTIDNQNELLRGLLESGLITISKKNDNLNMKVALLDSSEEIVYKVTNFEKLGNQFIGNFKEGYKQCEVCGKPIKIKCNKTMYCKKCAHNMKILQNNKYYHEKLNFNENRNVVKTQ